ncbi:hypothetical protein LVY75_34875 (plasmid) [Sinorhizobium sp. B11]
MDNENETETEANLPAPSVTRLRKAEEWLDLKSLNMDKSGRQGDVLVSKGMAGSSVSKARPAATEKRR